MADIPKVKRNIQRMIEGGASEQEIDAYVGSEGVAIEELQGALAQPQAQPNAMDGMLSGAPLMSNGMKDIRDQAAVGLVEGVASGPGMLGDLGRMYDPEKEAAAAKQSPFGETAYNVLNAPQRAMAWGMSKLPSTDDIMGGIAKLGGEPIPEAQTPAGEWARLGGNFLPLAATSLPRNATKQAVKQVPSVQKLFQAAENKYTTAKASKHVFDAQSYNDLVDDIGQTVVSEGADRDLHTGVSAVMRRMVEDAGTPKTVKEMQTLRRMAKNEQSKAFRSGDTDQSRLAKIIKKKIDQFVEPKVPEFSEANALKARAHRGEDIERLISTGERKGKSWWTGAGPENAIRRQFEQFTTANKGRNLAPYDPATRKAIEHTAVGTRGQRALRSVGKLAPTSAIHYFGSPAATAGLSYLLGPAGTALGVGSSVVGAGARLAATRATRKNAAMASALARSGGKLPKYRSGRPTRDQIVAAILGSSAAVNSQ